MRRSLRTTFFRPEGWTSGRSPPSPPRPPGVAVVFSIKHLRRLGKRQHLGAEKQSGAEFVVEENNVMAWFALNPFNVHIPPR